jgi:hypothetical protein
MTQGIHASGNAHATARTRRQPARTRRQPAYGEQYLREPQRKAQGDETPADGDAGRWVQWPVLFVATLVEIAWLVALAYVIRDSVSQIAG